MKKLLAISILSIGALMANAQTETPTNAVMKVAISEVVAPSASYFLLYDKGGNPDFIPSDTLNYINRSVVTDVPFGDFLAIMQNDSSKISWNSYNLPKAKLLSAKDMPKKVLPEPTFKYVMGKTSPAEKQKYYQQNIIPVSVSPSMSRAEIQDQFFKAKLDYDSRPAEEKIKFWFSKPVFSKDGQYALVTLRSTKNSSCCVYKLTDGQWVKRLEFKSSGYN